MNAPQSPRRLTPALRRGLAAVFLAAATAPWASAGPYPPAAGKEGSDAVARDDPRIQGWAIGVAALERGPVDITLPGLGRAAYGTPASALGPADVGAPEQQPEPGTEGPFQVVSLGDGGSITLTFSPPLADGEGPDLAVFENSFRDSFLELAFVEVSSDGVTFFRFPAVSLTPTDTQANMSTALDATNLHNLAGKYRARFGTPFDLADFATPEPPAGLDLQRVTHVRIIDVIGSVDPEVGSRDSLGNLINDPWPTAFESGGFDLDAVAALHLSNEGLTYDRWKAQFAWPEYAGSDLPDGDPDHDGVPNLFEYAFATDPLAPSLPPEPTLTWDDGLLTARFPAVRTDATDLTAGVETSAGLDAWEFRPGLDPLPLGGPGTPATFSRLVLRLTPP